MEKLVTIGTIDILKDMMCSPFVTGTKDQSCCRYIRAFIISLNDEDVLDQMKTMNDYNYGSKRL